MTQPSFICDVRSREEHDRWTQAFVAQAVFGHRSPWETEEFRALNEGFNLALSKCPNAPTCSDVRVPALLIYMPKLIASHYRRSLRWCSPPIRIM